MRKILLVFAVCVCSAVFAENIVLDLSNPGDFPIEYDESGLWADVFNNDSISLFAFVGKLVRIRIIINRGRINLFMCIK